jgi:hypothetical protein
VKSLKKAIALLLFALNLTYPAWSKPFKKNLLSEFVLNLQTIGKTRSQQTFTFFKIQTPKNT